MHRAWKGVLEKILTTLRPKIVVEIGCASGKLTKYLAEYCLRNDALLHCIEPEPTKELLGLLNRYQDISILHKTRSLDALQEISLADLVLIDGDHNWYTVHEELELLEKKTNNVPEKFPMVVLHDVGWPYGRRDMYYHPESIPEKFRMPYALKGIIPGKSDLVHEGGLNSHLNNAVKEGGTQNGVLTAIEDFIKKRNASYELIIIPGFHGIGLLFHSSIYKKSSELTECITKYKEALPIFKPHIEQLEKNRINLQIELEQSLQEKSDEIRKRNEKEKQLVALTQKIKALEAELTARDQTLDEKRREIKFLRKQLKEGKSQLNNLNIKYQQVSEQLSQALSTIQQIVGQSKIQHNTIEKLETDLQKVRAELTQKAQKITELQRLAEKGKLLHRLPPLDSVVRDIDKLLNSRRWRAGHALGEIKRHLLLNPKTSMPHERLANFVARYRILTSAQQQNHGKMSTARSFGGKKRSFINEKLLASLQALPLFLKRTKQEFRRVENNSSIPKQATVKSVASNHSLEYINEPVIVEATNGSPVDVIICVHNALDDTKRCIDSIKKNTLIPYNLIVVDDGSDEPTASYLRSLKDITLIRNETSRGYTRSANIGLKASKGPIVVLINSDTVVTLGWLGRLVHVFVKDPKCGLASPLSNAASYQSVPRVFAAGSKEWNLNPLPLEIDRWAELISETSSHSHPILPNLNGFCLAIKRDVIDKIGFFDEEKYPLGYGEENDYCMRAQDAGFTLRVADDCFVFHSKSKSFTHEVRKELARQGHKIYTQTYGRTRLQANTDFLQNLNPLDSHRWRLRKILDNPKNLRICYILPVTAISGGVISVFQAAEHLNLLGVNTFVLVPSSTKNEAKNLFPLHDKLLGFTSTKEIPKICGSDFDILIATHNSSVEYVKNSIYLGKHKILPAYFVQDYEPRFYKPGTPKWLRARASYELIPDQILMAKTRYLVSLVKKEHPSVRIHLIRPGFNLSVYTPRTDNLQTNNIIRICAMIRPISPRRAPKKTLEVLMRVKEKYGDKVEVHSFGCSREELNKLRPSKLLIHHGVLSQKDTFRLLSSCDIFLDMSTYQAFGRTGLEAMAAGCVPILPVNSGPDDYAINQTNAIMVDTSNEAEVLENIYRLIEDANLRERLKRNALYRAAEFNCMGDVLTQWELLEACYNYRCRPPTVEIIILVHNKIELTRRCLQSLLEKTEYPNFRVTVVDNASDKITVRMLQDLAGKYKQIKIIRNESNLSFSAANNRAAQSSTAELLLFLNNDTEILQNDWLGILVEQLLLRPCCAAVGPQLLYPNGKVQSAGIEIRLDSTGSSFDSAKEIREPRPSRYVNGLTAACLLIRGDVFRYIGGFDERFFYGQEDIDLCLRLQAKGFQLYHVAESKIVHAESATRTYNETTKRNRELIKQKWKGKMINIIPLPTNA